MEYSYDIKCENLAQDFLEDEGEFTKQELEELAQMIQDTIEGYLEYGRKKREANAADAGRVVPIDQRPAKD